MHEWDEWIEVESTFVWTPDDSPPLGSRWYGIAPTEEAAIRSSTAGFWLLVQGLKAKKEG